MNSSIFLKNNPTVVAGIELVMFLLRRRLLQCTEAAYGSPLLFCAGICSENEQYAGHHIISPAHLMYLLMPILYVCGELGKLDAKAHERF